MHSQSWSFADSTARGQVGLSFLTPCSSPSHSLGGLDGLEIYPGVYRAFLAALLANPLNHVIIGGIGVTFASCLVAFMLVVSVQFLEDRW